MSKTNNQDIEEGCKYCGTMWYEVQSEGAPCGIDDCDTYTCCTKAWEDHVKQFHPMETIKSILEQNKIQYKNRNHAIAEGIVLITDIPIDIYLLCQTYSLKTPHITIELKKEELNHLMPCIEKIWNIEKMFQLEKEAK